MSLAFLALSDIEEYMRGAQAGEMVVGWMKFVTLA